MDVACHLVGGPSQGGALGQGGGHGYNPELAETRSRQQDVMHLKDPASGEAGSRFIRRLRRAESGPLAIACLAYLAVISVFFTIFPSIDLAATSLFHRAGEGFPLASQPFFMRLRELGPFLVKLIAGSCAAILLFAFLTGRIPEGLRLRTPLFLLSTLAIGPGVVVNALFKNNWGRPRPNAVDAFGGDAPYVPVWRITDHCDTNCSFVSGEASSSFWLIALAFVAPPAWRKAVLVAVLPLVVALSANRVAFGGHFLSDTLISWGLTLLVIVAVHHLLYGTDLVERQAPALRAAFMRAGSSIRLAISAACKDASRALGRFIETMR